jgi:hypothetical protein
MLTTEQLAELRGIVKLLGNATRLRKSAERIGGASKLSATAAARVGIALGNAFSAYEEAARQLASFVLREGTISVVLDGHGRFIAPQSLEKTDGDSACSS